MAVLRVNKTSNYTVMSNYHFREKEMSLKAKGLLSLMLSLPDNWDYSINGLVAICKENETAINSTLKELKKFGYLSITKTRNNKGYFEYTYDIYENPHPQVNKPAVENLGVDNPSMENQGQLSNNISSIKKESTLKKDIKDKRDTRGTASINNIIEKPNNLTKELVKVGYIEENNIFIDQYNELINDLIEENGLEIVRSCLWYFVKYIKNNTETIDNKFAYFKITMQNNVDKLDFINNGYEAPTDLMALITR